METGLKSARVLVAGASRGIGLAIASAFVAEGASVLITGRDEASLSAAANDLSGSGTVYIYTGDLNTIEGVEGALAAAKNEMGGLDHFIFNIGSGRSDPPFEESTEEFQRMLEINLVNAQRMARVAGAALLASEVDNRSMTFIGSICGQQALGAPAGYSAAKEALWGYVKSIARPLAEKGIRVNMVSPGNIFFEGGVWDRKIKEDKAAVDAMLESAVPMKRLGTPQEVASAVVYLASAPASFISGANLRVDGGQLRG